MGIKPKASRIPKILLGNMSASNRALIKGIRTKGAPIKATTKKTLSTLGKTILLVIMKDRKRIMRHAA